MTATRRAFLAAAAAPLAAAATPPNIVLLLLDDLGYGDFGCYGQRHIQTPNIEKVAADGLRLTDCHSGAVVCAPSRSVLMTGLHTGHTPIRANAGTAPIAAEDVTVAQVLKQRGYATGAFGKWGLGDAGSTGVPTRHGFDRFFGYLHQVHAHSYYPEFLWDNDAKFPLAGNRGGARGDYSADLIADRSLAFVRENRRRPFFLYACWTLPHARFEVPSLAPYEKETWPDSHKTYAAMVTRADTHAGRLLALLKELDLERNTIVLISSDNGAHSGEAKGFEFFRSNANLRGEKGQLYEGGIRVPMIARWPGRVPAGRVSDFPCAFCDFLPTAAEIAGAKPPAGIDGVSVLPVLTGGPAPAREFLYWESQFWDGKTRRLRPERMQQAARMGDWKVIRLKPGAPLELYNLRRDPAESTNVAAQNPQVVARIEDYLKTARTEPRSHSEGSMQWVA